MENTQALKWTAIYFGLWLLAGVVGLAIAGIGVAIGALWGTGFGAYVPVPLVTAPYPLPGRALIVVGLLAWKFGSAAAFFKTATSAFEDTTQGQLNTEALKSDVLSVLDDRLSEMHQEVTQTKRLVNRLSRDDAASQFEFEE